jgi:hypothetical protein
MQQSRRLLCAKLHCVCLLLMSLALPASGQNLLLKMFRPHYKEGISLRTDSLFVRTNIGQPNESTRFVRFAYTQGLPVSWHEMRSEQDSSKIWKLSERTEPSDDGWIVHNEAIDGQIGDTMTIRTVMWGNQTTAPDSILYETKTSEGWRPIQKKKYTYDAEFLLRNEEMLWDINASQWTNQAISNYTYDAQKRLLQQQTAIWEGADWTVQNTYRFVYAPGTILPKCQTWQSGDTRVDSIAIWYDLQGVEDSSVIYHWDVARGAWFAVAKRALETAAEKEGLEGHYYSNNGASDWKPKERYQYVESIHEYTNEPTEAILQQFDPVAEQWVDKVKKTSTYQVLADGRIHGILRTDEASLDAGWVNTFWAEAWFHLPPDGFSSDSLSDDRNDSFSFSYNCGMSNPYVQHQTLSFPSTNAEGNYELKIFGEDGRLVFQQQYEVDGLATVSAPLIPGLYIVSVKKGGMPLCTQKLIVK